MNLVLRYCAPTRRQVNAKGLLREVQAAEEVLEAEVGTQGVYGGQIRASGAEGPAVDNPALLD